ncbi:paraquat-inducible protein A [Palleronia caenipelagi]|uniref:Paraquat-inducible protein A n=2 Tax=Palleronia caenipelagi TaxID=2489174 RepID=A0A547Q2V1_9RHOB|nr:paraquat-inducible protein A [Palleronia caenipelagi]
MAGSSLDEVIACPECDALYHARMPEEGARLVCKRCHHVLIAPQKDAYLHVVSLALTTLFLMGGAIYFPFLGISAAGFENKTSVLKTVMAFLDEGFTVALSIFVAAFIIMIPAIRSILVIYVILPLMMGRKPAPYARTAFRVSEDLRPWSMAEIFIIGCAVALVKIVAYGKVEIGPAFWLFIVLVIVTVLQDISMDRWSIWKALERRS